MWQNLFYEKNSNIFTNDLILIFMSTISENDTGEIIFGALTNC